MIIKDFIIIASIAIWYVVCVLFILINLNFYPFFGSKPFLFEILKTDFDLPVGWIFLCSVINIFLFFLLTRNIFSKLTAFITAALFASSWWSIYLGVFNSLFSLEVFFGLIFGLGLILEKKNHFGIWLIGLGTIGLLSSSLIVWVMFLILLVSNLRYNFFKKKLSQVLTGIVLIYGCILLFFVIQDPNHFKQIAFREITIFEDVGLINTVNNFQGEAQLSHMGFLGRVIDNKYSYLGLKVLNNLLVQFFPLTFFTPAFKLFNFSQTPPILFGFLLSFVWGIKEIMKRRVKFKFLGIFLLLILPSVLSSNSPDLNRLFLISPLLFIIIALGLTSLKKAQPKLFWLTGCLVVVQELVILTDIYLREPLRLLPMVIHVYGKLY